MAKVTLDAMLGDVSRKLGNVVYSEWKGIRYVRKYKKGKDANSDAQVRVRETFAQVITCWKSLPQPVKKLWEFHVKGIPLTGYNLFFKSNFGRIKNGEALQIAKGTGIDSPWNLASEMDTSGNISVTYETGEDATHVSFFVRKKGETGQRKAFTAKFDTAVTSAMPLTLGTFDPSSDYELYAVATGAPITEAKSFSDSEVCGVKKQGE